MTQARYDTDLLGDELARSLADVERNFAAAVTVMLTHIGAAFPGCIEAVQHATRPVYSATAAWGEANRAGWDTRQPLKSRCPRCHDPDALFAA